MRPMIIAVVLMVSSLAVTQQPSKSAKPQHWRDTQIRSLKMAVISGDPDSESPFVVRMQAVRDVRIPPHWYRIEVKLTLLEGTAALGFGSKFEDTKLHPLEAGEPAVVLAERKHFAKLEAGAEIEISGRGPLVTKWVDPSLIKDPMRDVDSLSDRSKKKAEDDKR